MSSTGTYSPRRVYQYRHTPTGVGWRWALAWTVAVATALFTVGEPGALTAMAITIATLGFLLFWFAFAWVSILYRSTFNKPRWEWVALALTPFGLFAILFSIYLAKTLITTVASTVIRTLLGRSKLVRGESDKPFSSETSSGNISPAEIYVRNLIDTKQEFHPDVIPENEPVTRTEDVGADRIAESVESHRVEGVDKPEDEKLRKYVLEQSSPETPSGLKMELSTKFLLIGIPLTLLAGLTTFVVIFYFSGGFK